MCEDCDGEEKYVKRNVSKAVHTKGSTSLYGINHYNDKDKTRRMIPPPPPPPPPRC